MASGVELRPRGSEGYGPRSPRAEKEGTGGRQDLLLPGDHERLQAVERAGHFTIPVGTHWVERDVLYVSEEITRRWPNLMVASCSCGRCLDAGHYPHMVVEDCQDGQTRPVFGFVKFGRHIIEQLAQAQADARSGDVLERMKRDNQRVLDRAKVDRREKADEAKDILVSALKSPKHDWRGPYGLRTDPSRGGRVA